MYTQASQAHQASFSPFVLSVDGLMARKAHSTVKRVASKLAIKWGRSYGEVMGWVQSRLPFAMLQTTNQCVHGSRVRWRSGFGMEDGAGLAMIMH